MDARKLARSARNRPLSSASASAEFLEILIRRLRTLLAGRLQNFAAIFQLAYDVQVFQSG
jgi:hypothetical protein